MNNYMNGPVTYGYLLPTMLEYSYFYISHLQIMMTIPSW